MNFLSLILGISLVNSLFSTDLSHFSAREAEGAIELKWVVTEINQVAYFKLEHSKDNKHYEVLKRISSNGQSTHSYKDKNAGDGENYYRLRMYDTSGQSYYSEAILIETGKGKVVNIPTGAKWRSEDYNYE